MILTCFFVEIAYCTPHTHTFLQPRFIIINIIFSSEMLDIRSNIGLQPVNSDE